MLAVMSSCAPTRKLPEGECLFVKSKIAVDKKKADVQTIRRYERISPNQKVLGLRFHLFLYSLANSEKENFPHGWLKKIGEPPVIYDSILINNTRENFKKFLSDKGFSDVRLESEVVKRRKKVKVKYDINLGEPILIRKVDYYLEDTSISKFFYPDTVNSFVKKKYPFDKFMFQEERVRIERSMKNEGFYKFSREYVFYEVTPTDEPHFVDVIINIKEDISGNFDPISKVRRHKQYKIKDVYIIPERRSFEGIRKKDSVFFNEHRIVYYNTRIIKPTTLVRANNLLPGSLYSLTNVEKTYNDYSSLGLFRYVNLNFEEEIDNQEYNLLNCNIDLEMRKRQSYAFEFVITNSSYDLGVRGGITYNNYNIFRGGEHLQIGVSGAIESLRNRLKEFGSEPMREVGIVSKLETPKFILPFKAEEFQRKYKPRTELQLSYNYQNQPKYIRTIVNSSFGYNWKGNIYNRHVLHPLDFYLVKLPRVDTAYIDSIYKGTRLENSFTNHTILGLKYSFEFSNQQQKSGFSFVYVKYNVESAGFLTSMISKAMNRRNDSILFGVRYFQYIKTDIDFRNYNIITPRDRIVYRLFAGIGLPYGISEAMPFEKMYWSGGPYGIRAWGERTLGPGPYYKSSSYNQLGDIKLEANIEYRFKVVGKLEGALFVDAGNIWLLKGVPELPRSGFKFNTFYKDIAVGVGFGTRFDFSFVLLRTDFGFKFRDPSITEGSKIVMRNPDMRFWDIFTFQFGIGYPF